MCAVCVLVQPAHRQLFYLFLLYIVLTAGADYFITVRREAHAMRDAKRNGFGRASRNESVLTAWFNLKVKHIRKRSTHTHIDRELR